MDPIRWRQVQDVFLGALEGLPAERGRFLDEACGPDDELRQEVESLLSAESRGSSLLDVTLEELLDLLDDEPGPAPLEAPARAGPYVLLEEIGRGGMGAVYRARRDDGHFDREVALKIVRLAGSREDTARRFRRERQILAGLEHPGIARLYDAGVTEDGMPYLAMELVRGEPIHRYCDRVRLSVPDRLVLFEQVVAAVDYAHRNLVIHRDLKPSNILVTEAGEVKLLDFGIAKLVETEGEVGEGDDPLTGLDHRLLTPGYASPEQMRGEPLTTASDVYSLGVLLHQILVGRRPDGAETTAPSAAARAGGEAATADTEAVALARRTTPFRLRRQLRGELDTLVLKALRPEADRRYTTAAAFLDDLVRFRSGRPITARPPSVAYRAGKFVGRNRVAVAAGIAALAGLVGGLGLALHQAETARRERDLALSVSTFLENLFTASNPFTTSGERLDTLPIRAFLDRAVDRLDSDLAGQPEVRARMQGILGSVQGALGVYDGARPLLEAALVGLRELKGEESPEVAEILGDLGRLLLSGGDPAGAERYYREALAVARGLFGERSLEVARIRTELAGVLLTMDRLPEAEAVLQASIDVRREEYGEESAEMADNLNMLGALQYRQGKVDQSIVTMGLALEATRRTAGEDHPGTAVLAQNLALALHRRGRSEEAEPLLRGAIAEIESSLGPDYPPLGVVRKTLANVLDALDRWEEADSLYQEAIAFTRRFLGEGSQDLGIALYDHGGALMRRGELDRARPLLDEAVQVQRAVLGPESPGAGITLGGAAEVRRRQGEARAAERMFREALGILEKTFPPGHPRVLAVRSGLGLSVADQGRTGEGEAMLLEVYEAARLLEDGGMAAREAARSLATLYEGMGDGEEAARWRGRGGEGEGAGGGG